MFSYHSKFAEKFTETLEAVVPILAIVLILCFTIAPIPPSVLVTFLIGALLLIAGMLLFNVGVESSMTPIGERVGSIMTRSKNVFIMVAISFIMGIVITISEPDLQVLAQQVPSIPNLTLILAVAIGVGMFLVISILRMLFGIPLSYLLLIFYGIIFVLTLFVPQDFLSIAFDSGGVTTGPMTVPFIMSFGVGIAAIRSDRHAEDDSFGLVALCSIGPILAVLILGMIFTPESTEAVSEAIPIIDNTVDIGKLFLVELPHYIKEMAMSIFPIVFFFGIFELFARDINRLTKQVEEITSGAISAKSMGTALSLGVATSVGLAMIRVLTGISILWFIVPGYFIALILTGFVPKLFTAIAFDSGGVASGPMTATFLLPFAMGACKAVGGNIITDAFGVVAMVAMTPLITIQTMGLIYRFKESKLQRETMVAIPETMFTAEDMEIIEL